MVWYSAQSRLMLCWSAQAAAMVSVAEVSAPGLARTWRSTSTASRTGGGWCGGVGVGVVAGVDVEPVGVAAAGGGDVQHLAAGGRGDERVGGVDGAALGAVGGGGIAEVDMVTDVVGREGDLPVFDPCAAWRV